MQNALLVVLREMHRYTPATVAKKLEVDTTIYNQIESGELLLNYPQAKTIGQLYKVKPAHIYESARQLDALLTQHVLVLTLKSRLGDIADDGNLKELCHATIKVTKETDKFLKMMIDHTQQMAEGFAKTFEQASAIIEQTNRIVKQTNAQLKQTDEVYHLVNETMKGTKEAFTETYDTCRQSIKEISEMNDSLKHENAGLREKLNRSSLL
jgi:methyl-accepting chemotaxis protein